MIVNSKYIQYISIFNMTVFTMLHGEDVFINIQ